MNQDFHVRTSFTPIRMMSGSRDPVSLSVEVRNKTKSLRNYTLTVKLNTRFGLDPSLLMREKHIRMLNVSPGQAKDAVFSVYGRYNLEPGFYQSTIVVREHANRFDRVLAEDRVIATLRVEAK